MNNNIIYKIDLTIPGVVEFLSLSGMDIHEFRIGINASIIVTGLRFSDLKNVTLEIDGNTGTIINQWEDGSAPIETEVIELVPVF